MPATMLLIRRRSSVYQRSIAMLFIGSPCKCLHWGWLRGVGNGGGDYYCPKHDHSEQTLNLNQQLLLNLKANSSAWICSLCVCLYGRTRYRKLAAAIATCIINPQHRYRRPTRPHVLGNQTHVMRLIGFVFACFFSSYFLKRRSCFKLLPTRRIDQDEVPKNKKLNKNWAFPLETQVAISVAPVTFYWQSNQLC